MRIVVYRSEGSMMPTVCTVKKNMDDPVQRDLLLFDMDNPVLVEEFEAVSWGHAMTYYKARYFGELYTNPDESVWDLWDVEEEQHLKVTEGK